eukprot:jgi/Botrbrau1/18398/Bobra.0776s0004.1
MGYYHIFFYVRGLRTVQIWVASKLGARNVGKHNRAFVMIDTRFLGSFCIRRLIPNLWLLRRGGPRGISVAHT